MESTTDSLYHKSDQKIGQSRSGSQINFVNQEYDYRQNWTLQEVL